ncbi:hypothetical protein AAG570_001781 [Ranatra chinensis]|uniref:G-protein coupled receptors family 2 profile 2 domain-containing protein n=1 Tax=Ranatra chinensis TaxID=642074 RepID=A0ABD0Y9S7_9HEMI
MIAELVFLGLVISTTGSSELRKCCPQGEGIADDAAVCTDSRHLWMYANLTYGTPGCRVPRLTMAVMGARVGCIDSFENGTVAALVCPDEEDNNTTVLAVNLVSKCCPPDRKLDSRSKSCWSRASEGDRRIIQRFLNVLVSDFDGVVDVHVGFPKCSRSQVLVDYLVPNGNLWRRESESVGIAVPGEGGPMVLNPEESCVDVTEDHGTMGVRACQDAELICDVKGETCVRKCCPEGKHLRKGGCQESHRPMRPLTVYEVTPGSGAPPLATSRTPIYRYSDPCKGGKYILRPDLDPKDTSYLDTRGLIYLPHGSVYSDRYCIEDVLLAKENVTVNGTFVFLCFPEEVHNSKVTVWLPAGLIVSCFFLFVTFVVYACLPSLHNLHGKNLMCYVFSLLVAFLCLAAMQLDLPVVSSSLHMCIFVGSTGQFTFLAAFCWLNVISFDIWWTIGRLRVHTGRKEKDVKRFLVYSLYAWGVPLLVTGVTILSDHYQLLPEEHSGNYCWFTELSYRHILFFFLPQIFVVGSNVVFYILTAINCSRVKNELNRFKHTAKEHHRFQADLSKMVMNIKLFVVMGVSWTLDIISMFMKPESWGWFLPDAANCLVGLLIFCIFVLKGKVLKALAKKLTCGRSNLNDIRNQRPSTSTLFTVVSSDCRAPNGQCLTKWASDSKLNSTNLKRNNLNVSYFK